MQQHTIQIFMWAWYPESAKIHQKVSGGFWRIQDMSNIYTGGFWWIQDTSILCVTKLVDFGGFRILSSKNTQGVRVNCFLIRWLECIDSSFQGSLLTLHHHYENLYCENAINSQWLCCEFNLKYMCAVWLTEIPRWWQTTVKKMPKLFLARQAPKRALWTSRS